MKKWLFIASFSFLFPYSVIASEVAPDIQLVMVGNSLAAVDEVVIEESMEGTLPQEAQILEREILLRKLAESQAEIKEAPLFFSKAAPEFKKADISSVNEPTVSVLSHDSFFEDVDREVIDPFRNADNFDNFLTRVMDFFDYNLGVYGEYDDNIFLTPKNKISDYKAVINQSFEIEYPMDKFYLEMLYAVNFDIYGKSDELVDTQNARFQLSYYPFEKLSVGFSNDFIKVGNSDIATSIGDQTLSLGYLTNVTQTELEYELWEGGFFEISHNFEYVNFSDGDVDIFIDRDVHKIDAKLKHRFTPVLSNYMGYRFKDVEFREFAGKDQESSSIFYGIDYELPGLATVYGEIEYESKDFKNTGGTATIQPLGIVLPFAERRGSDNNVNYKVGIESNFSRFNTIGLSYQSRILESSRPEFSQYLGKTFAVSSRTFLDNKTILFGSSFLEVQDFADQDVFSLFFADGDATTKIYATGVTLRRILSDWLYFDVGYTFVRRTTDFPGEGSNNSRFRFGARATF